MSGEDVVNGAQKPAEDEQDVAASTEEAPAAEKDPAAANAEAAFAETELDFVTHPSAEALHAEMEEMRANMLRALAEAENVRRRAARDVSDARQYAVTAFARDLLNVSDNFKRALSTVGDTEELPEELKNLLEGVRMTERELASVFEKHGVKMIDPTGERFDPNRHQAMFEIENADVASGTVLQVVQAGAMIGDRTLRPAMVGVSKGGPKPGAEPEPEAPAEGDAA